MIAYRYFLEKDLAKHLITSYLFNEMTIALKYFAVKDNYFCCIYLINPLTVSTQFIRIGKKNHLCILVYRFHDLNEIPGHLTWVKHLNIFVTISKLELKNLKITKYKWKISKSHRKMTCVWKLGNFFVSNSNFQK